MILPSFAAIGTYDTISQQFFHSKELPTISAIISWWDWRTWVVIGVILVFVAITQGYYRQSSNGVAQVVEELLSVGIFSDEPVNMTRILYELSDKLEVGLCEYEASVQDKLVLLQLNLRKIVQLEQRRTASGPRMFDQGYWVLTGLGKEVILYLQANKQVLDKEGTQS